MIKQTDKDKLKKLGIDIDAIITAHADTAEVDITVPDGELLTADQLTQRDANTKKDGIKEGEKNAIPLVVAEVNKYMDSKVLDVATIERYGDIGKQLKAKLSETDDAKLKAAQKRADDLLELNTTVTKERDEYKSNADKVAFQYGQYKHLPANRDQRMSEDEYLTVMGNRKIEAKEDGLYRNGTLMTDPVTKNALPHADAYKQVFEEFKWVALPEKGAAGGRGGTNSNQGGASGGKSRTYSEAVEKWKSNDPENNKNEMSAEFQSFVQGETKDNPTFNFDA